MHQGLHEEALIILNQLLLTAPHQPSLLYQRGVALRSLGSIDLAMTSFRAALKYAPASGDINAAIANGYLTQGNVEKAKCYYKKSFTIDPNHPVCLMNLVKMGDYREESPIIQKLLALYEDANIPSANRPPVCFALGNYYEKKNDRKRAFSYYQEGNQAAARLYPDYKIETDCERIDHIIEVFTPELLKTLSPVGNPHEAPIFILGMPRSGTTLVEHILSSHTQVYGAGETTAMSILALKALPYRTSGVQYPHAVTIAAPAMLQKLAAQYIKHLHKYASTNKAFICDKMPTNFLFIGLIHILFPNARIIHCKRDPMDTCWSIYKHLFEEGQHYSYDQKTLGTFYTYYQKLMQHWHRLLPGKIFEVEYEQMVENTETTIRDLLEYCGLPFEKNCLHFYRTQRNVATASAMQVRRPIYKTSLKSWLPIADELLPLRQALGLIPA